jgi:KDO2-lipid IV(A) lauroyltransferase
MPCLSRAAWALATLLARAFRIFLQILPRRAVDFLACAAGIFVFDVIRIRRKTILSNLKIAYPQWDNAKKISVGRASLISFSRTLFEFLDAPRVFRTARFEVHNEHILDEAIAKGLGIYILCCHLGNWELMCQYGSKRFRPVHVVVKPVGKGDLTQWVEKLRRDNGMSVISRTGPAGEFNATRQIFKTLKASEMVGFMADQRRAKGTIAPFFGRDCATNDSLIQLHARRPAPIIPVSLLRTGFGQFKFVVWPGLEVGTASGRSQDLKSNVSRMNECIETMVRCCPEQYFWMHKRWKQV